MKNQITFVVLILLGTSCSKEEIPKTEIINGVVVVKPYLWWNNEEEHDKFIITTPFVFNNSFIAESHQNNKSYVSLINGKSGKINWKWNDYLDINDIDIRQHYSYLNYLTFQSGRRTYCINLNSGLSEWKKTWDNSLYNSLGGLKNDLYLIEDYAESGFLYPGIKILELSSGNQKNKIVPHFKNTTKKNVFEELGRIIDVEGFERNGEEYFLVTYCEAQSYSKCTPLISLYNYSQSKWVYEYKKVTNLENTSTGFVTIANDKIYHDGASHVFCHDLWTGDSLWTRKFNGNFIFGSCTFDNGTLYCAAEGDGYYALDAETGAIKWKGERAPGTSSRMVVLNGVLYYVNGGDGRLWALDASSGKTLWRLKSPDDNFGFKREINVLPGDDKRKGYVLTSTWHGAVAYEAER